MTDEVFMPSPQTTLVILLGASEWPHATDFASSAAFANSAHDLASYFLSPRLFNLPAGNLLNLFDTNLSPDDIDIEIGQFLARHIGARDVLIYFTGHGGFAGGGSTYYLAIRRTRRENHIASSIPIVSVAHTLREKARYLRRVMILDCCFAGSAFTVFQGQGPAHAAIGQAINAFNVYNRSSGIPKRGTSLLCSSGSKATSIACPGERYTAFSGALLQVLKRGLPAQTGNLSLYNVRDLVEDVLRASYADEAPRPEVHSPDQSDGDVAALPFFPASIPRSI